jgi:hypothetical protein
MVFCLSNSLRLNIFQPKDAEKAKVIHQVSDIVPTAGI